MPRRNKTPAITKKEYARPSCAPKRRFSNQLAAQRQADVQMLQQPQLNLAVYHCQHCGGWHLTSR